MSIKPALGEALSIGSGSHAGTFWDDSISFTMAYDLGGFPLERMYPSTR